MRSQALDRAVRRIVWIRFAGLAIVFVLAGRAAHLTVAHTRAKNLYERQIQTEQRLSAARGTIFDRNGRELAITTRAESIYAVPSLMDDRIATAQKLAEILELDEEHLARRFTTRDGFTYVARWVDPADAERLRALDLPGVGIDAEPRRSYPAGALAAPLLGFANIDGEGVRGIEQLEHDWLTGRPRRVRVERDARGRALALHSTDPREVLGGDVALTLDAVMQGEAEAALARAVTESGARGGLVLTMDPKNGDLLTIAEAPGFDPNDFRHLDYHTTRAHTFTDGVEAGSTMKAFLVASALDAGVITPDQALDTEEGWIRVRGKTIKDRRPFGVLTPGDVLRLSSNVGAVLIAKAMGAETQHQGLRRFGFGRSTNSGFPFEAGGILRDWRGWQPVDQAAISYGQGLSVTAIQLASALAALANDGLRITPRLVLARRGVAGDDAPDARAWQTTPVERLGRAVSPWAARTTLDMMRTVVSSDGTGRRAGLRDVAVAGKTGTAQKLDVEAGSYSQDRYIAWFMGVVPADDPELAIVVAVDEPSGAIHSGGGIAAPLFARVAAAQLAHRGIVTEPAPFKPAPLPVRIALHETETEAQALPSVAAAPPALASRAEPEPASPALPIAPDPTPEYTRKEPPRAAVAAPPAGPAAPVAAGPSSPTRRAEPARILPSAPPAPSEDFDFAFVPDFAGRTMASARRLAEREALEITTAGAIEGRVVSQSPVPGTVLEGGRRTVRLRFETRTDAARRVAHRREEG